MVVGTSDERVSCMPRRGLTPEDVAALFCLLADLGAEWGCDIGADEGGDVFAAFEQHDCSSHRKKAYVVRRHAATLRLLLRQPPYGGDLIGVFTDHAALRDALRASIRSGRAQIR